MKNVTITVEDSVLEWARIEAARRGTSVSRMLGDFMAEMQRREDTYERAYLAWRTDERTWKAKDAPKTIARSVVGKRAAGPKDTQSKGVA
ncbi:hypothetical protein [Comamonas jiangduensis]|uniref:hypothetical protein n=1 Tax=Comamonas jiangduensis TaxID=1194168 RepID=UPI0028ACB39C|nr:hypothetical protein [Comamonas jiangduensis]